MFSCTEPAQLLTSAQTAQLIGLKPQTLRVWRLKGKGPKYIRLGDSLKAPVRYFESAILDWLSARRFSSTTEESEMQGAV